MSYELVNYQGKLKILCFVVSINQRLTHFHNEIEILYMLEGSVLIERRCETVELKKGEIFFVERNVAHGLKRTSEENLILTIQFDTSFCQGIYPRLSKLRFYDCHLTPADGRVYNEMKRHMFDIVRSHKPRTEGYPFRIMKALNALCINLVEDLRAEELSSESLAQEERSIARLNRVMDYVNVNFANRITLSDLAKQEGLDMCYLSHFIKKNLGLSFQQYLNKVRVKNAENLIVNTDKRNIDICMESGFSDYRYLTKAFVAEYGCTPSKYKRQNQNIRLDVITDLTNLDEQHVVTSIDIAVDGILERFDL